MDESWVQHLITEYSSGLLKYLVHHAHSREDAEDLLQDVFLSVYEHCGEFDPSRCNEQAWLYIIAKRKLVSYYRRFKQNDSIDEMEDYQLPGDNSMAEATNLMACRQAVALALKKLDERSREVVVLRYFNGMSYAEISSAMGISEGNARVIHTRALDVMKKEIGDFAFEEDD